MPAKYHIGIDISNLTLDVAVFVSGQHIDSLKIKNTEADISLMLKDLRVRFNCIRANTLFCAEHTGIYGKNLERVMLQKKWKICFDSPLRIKYSLGIARGKNDKIDAIRIAKYALQHEKELIFRKPPRPCIVNLKVLYSKRKLLLKIDGMLKRQNGANDRFIPKNERKYISALTTDSHNAIKTDIKTIETEMWAIIEADNRLRRINEILNSIPRVGRITSVCLIVSTNEFLNFETAKQYASYCGVAPYEMQSGTGMNKRPRVSYIANRELKTVLHIAIIGYTMLPDTPLGQYYLKKTGEGKNKMSVLNAMRNKLIKVAFYCVKNDCLYE